jgi:hypothetical protein
MKRGANYLGRSCIINFGCYYLRSGPNPSEPNILVRSIIALPGAMPVFEDERDRRQFLLILEERLVRAIENVIMQDRIPYFTIGKEKIQWIYLNFHLKEK